jgi:hypothetical protein
VRFAGCSIVGRDVVPNVPDLSGGVKVRAAGGGRGARTVNVGQASRLFSWARTECRAPPTLPNHLNTSPGRQARRPSYIVAFVVALGSSVSLSFQGTASPPGRNDTLAQEVYLGLRRIWGTVELRAENQGNLSDLSVFLRID